jgi:hypothetical protein
MPIRMPIFESSGDATERYRIALGFYGTGDSAAWTLTSEQFREFLRIQALGQLFPSLLQILISQGFVGESEATPRQKLLQRILARRDSIEAKRGKVSESYTLLYEDRER